MNQGETISFASLFKKVNCVEIPLIQRDYAQGREAAAELRTQFLDSIKNTLLLAEEDLQQPLDLDFIYGNCDGETEKIFSVLDGQQRLTTLFLLHWYLALKSESMENFQSVYVNGKHSRFTYKIRPSTTEFFDALVNAQFSSEQLDSLKLSSVITDSQWFFLSWKQDPTVQSCMTMIDAIHTAFKDSPKAVYSRLTSSTQPYITFNYLDLETFKLTDELYIKMNARGEPLSDFENFKAWLFGQIEEFDIAKTFEQSIDQEWTDFFWKLSRGSKASFDELYLKFFNLMAFYSAAEKVDGNYRKLGDKEQSWLRSTRASNKHISHKKLEKNNSFSNDTIQRVTAVLDFVVKNPESKFVDLLTSVLTNNDYVTQTELYAQILFIAQFSQEDDWDSNTYLNMKRWVRVTSNLINNFRIDELPSFLPSIKVLMELSEYNETIYEHLSDEQNKTRGFSSNQWSEETLKASLILHDEAWESLLVKYEQHVYLKGKVGFILDVSKVEGVYSKTTFEDYASKVSILLGDKMLRSHQFLLQRALLSFGDYLIRQGNTYRYSFGLSNRNTYRERSDNWLSVVQKQPFKDLLLEIGSDVEKSLKTIVEDVDCGGWRELIVRNMSVIQYCTKRLIYRNAENIVFLLSKTNFRGWHVELRTFTLYQGIKKLQSEGESLPEGINKVIHTPVYGNYYPYIKVILARKKIVCLTYEDGSYTCYDTTGRNDYFIDLDEDGSIEMPDEITGLLEMVE